MGEGPVESDSQCQGAPDLNPQHELYIMATLEINIDSVEDMSEIISFLKDKRVPYTLKGGSVETHADRFYRKYGLDKYTRVKPTVDFAKLCGPQYMNKRGEMELQEIYTFIQFQLTNPSCYFISALTATEEYTKYMGED